VILVTLRDPTVARPALPYCEDLDPETAYRAATVAGWDDDTAAAWAAWTLGLPVAAGEDGPIHWSIREVRHLRFLRELARHGSIGHAVDAGPTPAWYLEGAR
jgi:hypothetical protein